MYSKIHLNTHYTQIYITTIQHIRKPTTKNKADKQDAGERLDIIIPI